MKIRKRWLIATSAVLLIALSAWMLRNHLIAWYLYATLPPGQTEPVLVTISPKTTRITSPLLPNGYPDYVGAMNQVRKKNVTPANNAAIILLEVLGTNDISEELLPELYAELGIAPLPKDGKYLETWTAFVARLTEDDLKPYFPPPVPMVLPVQPGPEDDPLPMPPTIDKDGLPIGSADLPEAAPVEDWQLQANVMSAREVIELQFDTASQRAWIAEEFPLVARSVQEQQPQLDRLLEIKNRERFYFPYLMSDKTQSTVTMKFDYIMMLRQTVNDNVVLANYELSQGRYESVIQRLLLSQRLSNELQQGATLVEHLVGYALSNIAKSVWLELLQQPNVTLQQLTRWEAAYRQLYYEPDLAKAYDEGERYMYLSTVSNFAQQGELDQLWFEYYSNKRPADKNKSSSLASRINIDYDRWLSAANQTYDELIVHQSQELTAGTEFKPLIQGEPLDNSMDNKKPTLAFQLGMMNKIQTTDYLTHMLHNMLLPAYGAVHTASQAYEARHQLLLLHFALRQYQLEHGNYPVALFEVAKYYGGEMPLDPFSGQPFLYCTNGQGFILYSVGENGHDEQGSDLYDEDISVYSLDYKPQEPVPVPFEAVEDLSALPDLSTPDLSPMPDPAEPAPTDESPAKQ